MSGETSARQRGQTAVVVDMFSNLQSAVQIAGWIKKLRLTNNTLLAVNLAELTRPTILLLYSLTKRPRAVGQRSSHRPLALSTTQGNTLEATASDYSNLPFVKLLKFNNVPVNTSNALISQTPST